MKQNGQWLSQVRTRSNTALASSRPSGAPAAFSTTHELLEPAAADLELDARLVGLDLVADDVAHRLAVEREQLVTGEEPGGSCRRAGRDRHHTGGRHRAQSTGSASARTGVTRRVPSDVCPSSRSSSPQPRGFCAGVEMAIKALSWMVRVFEPPVYCYHEIVHNRLVVDRFRELGRGVRRRRRRRARRARR